MNKNAYFFNKPLTEGLILKRKNRFIMNVSINGKEYPCHCPTTGRIGNIVFENIPCLLSESKDPARKTPYTVEAFSLDLPSRKKKRWIGINQNAVNRYIEHFLKNGALKEITGKVKSKDIQREQKLGISKIDFKAGGTYIEVKMPLIYIQADIGKHIKTSKVKPFDSIDRLVKHINDLAENLKEKQRAAMITCFVYDNPGFQVGVKSTKGEYVREQIKKSIKKGVEMWQVNLNITPEGVELSRYANITKKIEQGRI